MQRYSAVKKNLLRLSSKSAMPAPLGNHAAAKLKREAGYEFASSDVSRWTSIVRKNRESEQLVLDSGVQTGHLTEFV